MATMLIDYKFDALNVSNPDGTFPVEIKNATVVAGPGTTSVGEYPSAVDLGTNGHGSVVVDSLAMDLNQFAIRVVFLANGPLTGRQNLVESNVLPFALFLAPRSSTECDLVAAVSPKAHDWRGASTKFVNGLKLGVWYVADLVYDVDTLGVFVNEQIKSVHAFPVGTIDKFRGHTLFVGTWIDEARDHFNGRIAAVKWSAGVPDNANAQLDEWRSKPEWFITHKVETVRGDIDLGEPTEAIEFNNSIWAYTQKYERGLLMYHDSEGAAFEMHHAIHERYSTLRDKSKLGYLVSDEAPFTKGGGRKNIFSKGGIYWSRDTGAVPVYGQIYLDYEALGEARGIGFPLSDESTIAQGLQQEFQGARMYFKNGDTNAHEVQGAILAKYLALGGPARFGFPITNEFDILKNITNTNRFEVLGKSSEFEGNCTIYWSSRTGAFEVSGQIRDKYLELAGPQGALGFPTSGETDIPGASGLARCNTFEHATLLWYGTPESIVVARPFKLFIQRINADESEDLLSGENDMYIFIKVWDGGQLVYSNRLPSSGDWGGRNIVDVNFRIPLTINPDLSKTVMFQIDVWEADTFGDDHLGIWTKTLEASNGWGLGENGGILDSGSFSRINSIRVAVQPDVEMADLSDVEKFWGASNASTDNISYQQYAAAFSDVDSETEWWDVTDSLEQAFYDLVIKHLARAGNCVGMSVEAVYSRKSNSLYSMPLNRFTDFKAFEHDINIRHLYQAGASAVYWAVGEFISGNTHDPVDVFRKTRDQFARGNDPVICIAQNYDFSGAPHCILPVAWDSSAKPWRITISDPNFPNELKTLTVDPDKNTFEYIVGKTYSGGAWSGGRFHYMPFSILSNAPRTPVWDAILLILQGTIIMLGDDAQTRSITDGAGRDLDGLGNRALAELKEGRNLQNFFVPYKGYNRATSDAGDRPVRGKGSIAGELLIRRQLQGRDTSVEPAGGSVAVVSHLPINELTVTKSFRKIRGTLLPDRRSVEQIGDRTLHHVAADPVAMKALPTATSDLVRRAVEEPRPGDFRHIVEGLRRGSFNYSVKHALSELKMVSTLIKGELTTISADDIGTSTNTVGVKTDRNKELTLEVTNKLGVAGDYVRLSIDRVATPDNVEVQLNLKPGLGGVEILTSGQRVEARVEVEAKIRDSVVRRGFNVPIEGGTRLKLSTILSQNVLGASRIEKLFGPSKDAKIIRSS